MTTTFPNESTPAATAAFDPPLPAASRVRITATRIRALDSALAAAFKANQRADNLASELLAGRENDDSAIAGRLAGIHADVLTGDIEAAQRESALLLVEFGSLL